MPSSRRLVALGALAYRDGASTSSSTSGGGTPQADGGTAPDLATLQVVVGSHTFVCDSSGPERYTDQKPNTCDASWGLNFSLPSALQVPGVHSLNDPALQAFFIQTMGPGNGGCVGGGGAPPASGTVEILSIDAKSIKLRLSEMGGFSSMDLPQADGDYDAPLCM